MNEVIANHNEDECVVLDYETEMIGDYGDPFPRVIQIGMVKVQEVRIKGDDSIYYELQPTASLRIEVDPERRILHRPEALQTALIDRHMRGNPVYFDAAIEMMRDFAGNLPMAAFPIDFEAAVTHNECHRMGFDRPSPFDRRCIDIGTLARFYIRGASLQTIKKGSLSECCQLVDNIHGTNLAQELNQNRHDALNDAMTEAKLYCTVVNNMRKLFNGSC